MDDPVLVRVVDGIAEVGQQAQTIGHRRVRLDPPLREVHALDELHREVGRAIGAARIEQPRDAGMVEPPQDLDLAPKAPLELRRDDTGPQDLEGDDGRGIAAVSRLRAVDDPHAPLSEEVEHAVGAELRRHNWRIGPGKRRVEGVGAFGVVGEEVEDLGAKLLIAATRRVEEAQALLAGKRQGGRKDFPCPKESFAIDGRDPPRPRRIGRISAREWGDVKGGRPSTRGCTTDA